MLHFQGSLDGLCGIYATINSVSLLLNGRIDSPALFAAIIRYIGRGLPIVLLNGMLGPKLERKVLKPCIMFLKEYNIELCYQPMSVSDFDQYWSMICEHYEDHGGGSVLFSISGSYEHWVCASKITPRCIFLVDSSGFKQRLHRSRTTITEPTKKRPHALLPSETFLLSVN